MSTILPMVAVSALIVYTIVGLKIMRAVEQAPVGYEDESGFHYGMPTDRSTPQS